MKTAELIPVKGFLETSLLEWPGNICSVVFLPGCNLRCPFCHNTPLVLDPSRLTTIPFTKVQEQLHELEDWIDGVCVTGGEPTIHENLPALLRRFKDLNLPIKLDTNGSNPAMIESLIRDKLIACVAMDIKAPLVTNYYARLTGCDLDLKAVKKSINLIRSSSIQAIFRMTVVPELIDEEDIYQVARSLAPDHHLVLQQFSPDNALDPSLRTSAPWPQSRLEKAQEGVHGILRQFRTPPSWHHAWGDPATPRPQISCQPT
jgi:pyruvate formate lyase activating enzyme